MKRILLTGANGFIGSQTIPLLIERGYEVHAILYGERLRCETHDHLTWHDCDLLEPGCRESLVSEVGATHLLHFAWTTTHGEYWSSPDNVRWLEASLGLVESFVDHGGKRIVGAGTCAEYDWDYGFCSEELTPRKPRTLYGTCKNSLQEALAGLCTEAGVSGSWGRVFFLYGPGESEKRLVPSVINALLNDRDALCTDGDQVRDYMNVRDVAGAFVRLLDSDVEGPVNIASGKPIAVKQVIREIAAILGKGRLVKLGALPTDELEPPLLVADVRKLQQEVGFEPGTALLDGLRESIDWWRNKA